MSKGQSIIVQFVIFFVIGFIIFISIGVFFKYQADLFRQSILSSSVNLTSSYLSSATIAIVDSCKECDFVNLTINAQNTTTGYPIEMLIKDLTLKTYAPLTNELIATTIHNLLVDTLQASGSSGSFKPIILTFNRTNYTLRID